MSSRLTAMDVEKQEFSRKMRGYDADEVRLYLKSVAEEIERIHLDHGRLLEDNGRLRGELEELRAQERTLQATLVSAQQMCDATKERARAEGELLLREARQRAEDLLREGRDEMARLDSDISRARLERETLESRLRSVIEQHQTMLDMRRSEREERDNVRRMPRRAGSEAG